MSAPDPLRTIVDRALDDILNLRPAPSPPPAADLPPSPSFPLETLPEPCRAYVRDSAWSARVPVEMVAVPFLAVAGSVIGNGLRFEVGPGWVEYPILWVALIAPSGSGKSPALAAARRPLDLLQQEDAAALARHTLRPGHPVRLDRLFTTDPSLEGLAAILQHQPGIAILRDELIGLVRAVSGRGARPDARQHLLAVWSGEPIAPARRFGSPVHVPHPVVGIAGGLQIEVARHLRSRDGDGLAERFLPILRGTRLRYWHERSTRESPPPDPEPVAAILHRLRHAPLLEQPAGILVTRTPEAGNAWATWYNDNVDRTDRLPHTVSGYYQKLPAHVARLALILHSLWHPDTLADPLCADCMTSAIALGVFLRVHIIRTLPLYGVARPPDPPKPTLDARILRALIEDCPPDRWVTRTSLLVRLGRPELPAFDAALATLTGQGIVETSKHPPSGSRKSATHYRAR